MKRLLAVFLVLVMALVPMSSMATFCQDQNIDIDINLNIPEITLPELDYGDLFDPGDFENPWEDWENPWDDFTDLDPDQWYWEAVEYCLENGLMEGMEDGYFFPNAKTTRAQLVTILWRLEGSPRTDGCDLSFDDVKSYAWYKDAVCWAAETGIVKGFDDTTFGPNKHITREQLVTILYRYAGEKDFDTTIHLLPSILIYQDAGDISNWALQPMQWAVSNEIIGGTGDGSLSPRDKATRAQIASIFHRFCENIVE
ncbi:MAG: S-layer homology domain-containing protein [Ruminiclostridium sp.]|nr:S-layer homology domain-containing protein [Ruminiclostridium sp.]